MTAAPALTPADLDTEPTSPAVVGSVIELDPAVVAQHPDNLRDASRDLKALTASVAEVGVLVPVIVVPVASVPGEHQWPAGTSHVAVDGNRRPAAARAAGLPLPCIVRPDLASAQATRRTMAVTGLVRDGLTVTEEAHAVAALFDAGMSQTAIGRALGRSREQVKTAKKAATLTVDPAESTDYPLTLDHLATLSEWEHIPGAFGRLIEAIERGRLDHMVATLRREADEDAVVSAAVLELGDTVTIAQDEPRSWGSGPRTLKSVRPSAGSPPGEPIDPAGHAACPGHAVWVEATDGPPNDDGEADDPARWDEDGEWIPGPLRVELTYLCTDPDTYGHVGLWDRRSTPAGGVYVDTEPYDGETDEETAARIEQARADAVATQAAEEEARRQERRDLIRNNKQAPVDCTIVSASSSCPGAVGSRSDRRWSCGCAGGTTGCRSAEHSHDRRGAAFRRWTVGGPGGRRSASDRVVEFPRGAGRGGLFSGDVPLLCA